VNLGTRGQRANHSTTEASLRRVTQPSTNVVKDEKGDLVTDSHSILTRWKEHFCQLLNVHGVNGDRV
jgi:hypothetical protein